MVEGLPFYHHEGNISALYVYTYTYTSNTYVYIYPYIYVHLYIYQTYMCTYIHRYIHIYTYTPNIYVYIYTHDQVINLNLIFNEPTAYASIGMLSKNNLDKLNFQIL